MIAYNTLKNKLYYYRSKLLYTCNI